MTGKNSAILCRRLRKEMTKLIKKEATNLTLEEMNSGEEYLEELAGYKYVFSYVHSRSPSHQPAKTSYLALSQCNSSNPPPVLDMESGQATKSASNMCWLRFH